MPHRFVINAPYATLIELCSQVGMSDNLLDGTPSPAIHANWMLGSMVLRIRSLITSAYTTLEKGSLAPSIHPVSNARIVVVKMFKLVTNARTGLGCY